MFSPFKRITDSLYDRLQTLPTLGGTGSKFFNSNDSAMRFGTIVHNVLLCKQPLSDYTKSDFYSQPCNFLYNLKILTTYEYETLEVLVNLAERDSRFINILRDATFIEKGFICTHYQTGVIIRCKFDILIATRQKLIIWDLKTSKKLINPNTYESQLRHYLWCAKHIFAQCKHYCANLIVALKNGPESSLEYMELKHKPYTDEEVADRCIELYNTTDQIHLQNVNALVSD